MPYASVFDLQMYFLDLGARDAPPLLLIHGSGETGRSEWAPVLDGLAKHFRLIVSDCRGHGQTLDPRSEYTFKMLAADMAELLRVLNLAPALVVGHSNGGNVALVLCAGHPEVVRRAVIMAANAYVSDDLLKYASPWSARIGEAWSKQLAELHDAGRYPGYWRDLMDRTGYEIARAPNFTPARLGQIRVPILVVQGENDPLNAPAHHAEFLAENLGNARLWLAPKTGHYVHKERPGEWVECVSGFLQE